METSRAYLDKMVLQLEKLRQVKRHLLVVSDLHLSEGFNEAEGVWAVNEDFFFDDPFSRFLQFAERQRARYDGVPWRLVCNGDIFDFRQVGVPRNGEAAPGVVEERKKQALRSGSDQIGLSESEKVYGPGTGRLMSGLRVDLVYQGHRGFFQALAWFVARGNELVFIKGNHDLELHWPKSQVGIKRLLAQAYVEAREGVEARYDLDWAGLPERFGLAERQRIFFLPWNYYEPGRVYIEHGQQFHGTDSQEHILWPVLPWDEDVLELSLGELFGRYFVNELETLFPLMDNMKPFSKGMNWVLNKGVPALLTGGDLFGGLKALGRQLRHALKGASLIYEKNRKQGQGYPEFYQKRQVELEEYGERIGLGAACARALDGLKSPPQLRSRRLMSRWLSIRLLEVAGGFLLFLTLLVALSALALIGAGIAIWGLKRVMMVYSAAGWLGAVLIWWLKLKMQRLEGHLGERAVQIHQVLHEHGKDVKYVFLGHDHHADLQRLDAELARQYGYSARDCFYVNSGTWTTVIVEDEELVQNARQFTFVRLVGDTAHLMRWNDGGGAWEPVVL